jgi:uncharacterized protein YbjT (DUF2867 family)
MNILLTGATGYIGGELRTELEKDPAVCLRVLVRDQKKINKEELSSAEIVEGSTFDEVSLRTALRDIDIAYYLIHSLAAKADFEALDRRSARNFLNACVDERVKRIIYLGGLGNKETASKHLLSRLETGEILSSRPQSLQTIWFRAGVIIGAGSSSFQIIRQLVQKLPVMTTPRWVRTKTQPIGIEDVIRYLAAAITLEVEENLIVDIGSEEMTFQEMLHTTAQAMGLRRLILPIPLLSPGLSSLWLILITLVGFRVAKALVSGLKSETVLTNQNAQRYFPQIRPLPYVTAVKRALSPTPK